MPQAFGSSTKMGKFENKYYQYQSQEYINPELECGQ